MTPQLVCDALRNLIEGNNVANRRDDAAEHMHELGRHMRQVQSDNALFHYRRHLGRIPGIDTHGTGAMSEKDRVVGQGPSRRIDHLLRSRSQILEDLCAAAELHDDPSGKHPYRVADLARRLALKIGLAPDESNQIAQAARLHDVGKVGVPPEILRKAGPLDTVETEIMRSHTTAGAELLASTEIDNVRTAVLIARHHHEWWSGAGYPDGLVGKSIPFAARITALAEAFDAMTHDRPYRPKLSVSRALEVITERAGRQFDPGLAPVFCELVLSLRGSEPDLDACLERDVCLSAFLRAKGRFALHPKVSEKSK